jgi:uncharacterized Ntn-hydrolase superfamily protein
LELWFDFAAFFDEAAVAVLSHAVAAGFAVPFFEAEAGLVFD